MGWKMGERIEKKSKKKEKEKEKEKNEAESLLDGAAMEIEHEEYFLEASAALYEGLSVCLSGPRIMSVGNQFSFIKATTTSTTVPIPT